MITEEELREVFENGYNDFIEKQREEAKAKGIPLEERLLEILHFFALRDFAQHGLIRGVALAVDHGDMEAIRELLNHWDSKDEEEEQA